MAHELAARVLAWPVGQYIRHQRNALAPAGSPLPDGVKQKLSGYFSESDLERVRLVVREDLPLAGTFLTNAARRIGWAVPGASAVAGITFDHVIATRQPPDPGLLFHEMVHVAQYRLLGGVGAFSYRYVHGLLTTGSYDEIPLERCAYQLEARFQMMGGPFSVEGEVSRWLGLQ